MKNLDFYFYSVLKNEDANPYVGSDVIAVADGLGGSVAFAYQADRTRLRWVIEQLDVATGISDVADGRGSSEPVSVEYYNLQGMKLNGLPSSGICIIKTTHADGTTSTVKTAR